MTILLASALKLILGILAVAATCAGGIWLYATLMLRAQAAEAKRREGATK